MIETFTQLKLWLVENTSLAKDALHIYVAIGVYLGSCLLLRWRASSWKPWVLVLAITLLGELWDAQTTQRIGRQPIPEAHWKDIWNTMMVPTILLIMARFTSVFERPAKAVAPADETLSDEL